MPAKRSASPRPSSPRRASAKSKTKKATKPKVVKACTYGRAPECSDSGVPSKKGDGFCCVKKAVKKAATKKKASPRKSSTTIRAKQQRSPASVVKRSPSPVPSLKLKPRTPSSLPSPRAVSKRQLQQIDRDLEKLSQEVKKMEDKEKTKKVLSYRQWVAQVPKKTFVTFNDLSEMLGQKFWLYRVFPRVEGWSYNTPYAPEDILIPVFIEVVEVSGNRINGYRIEAVNDKGEKYEFLASGPNEPLVFAEPTLTIASYNSKLMFERDVEEEAWPKISISRTEWNTLWVNTSMSSSRQLRSCNCEQ